jgi:hypothetical protein
LPFLTRDYSGVKGQYKSMVILDGDWVGRGLLDVAGTHGKTSDRY